MSHRLPLAGLALVLGSAPLPARPVPQDHHPERIVVLGMDGMDARLTRRWMEAGELPNFKRVEERGTFQPLRPGNPPQSPVSWATLNTGRNPGKHNVFDFVRVVRDFRRGTILPDIGFQKRITKPLDTKMYPLADPTNQYLILGGGVLLGLILGFLLRRNRVLAVVAGLVPAAAGVWAALSMQSAFPADGFPDYESLVKADEWWLDLDRAGIPFRGDGPIVTYPCDELQHGEMIAGLGSPDGKGGLNTFAIYTTEDTLHGKRRNYTALPAASVEDGSKVANGHKYGAGSVYKLVRGEDGVLRSKLFGPKNRVVVEQAVKEFNALRNQPGADPAEVEAVKVRMKNPAASDTWVPMEVHWNPGDEAAEVTIDGQTQTVALNSYSDFFSMTFHWSTWLSTHALVRVWAETAGSGLELYTTPLQIDPRQPDPWDQITWPRDWAAQLASRIGLFETLGWACQTHAVKDAELSDAAFLADIEFTYDWRMRMLEDAAKDSSWKVLFHFNGEPDRVCHMLMRHFDEKHPQYDPQAANAEVTYFGRKIKMKDAILETYRKMDDVVGYVLDHILGPDDELYVVSDHGFDSFRREVSINNWLYDEGFLAIPETDEFGLPMTKRKMSGPLGFVDWEKTKAYSMSMSKIYLAREGREPHGTVTDDQADGILDAITKRLYEMKDPKTGEKVVRKVYRREDIYSGDYVHFRRNEGGPGDEDSGAPELTIDFAPGYRVAWTTAGGGMNLVEEDAGDDGAGGEGGGTLVKGGWTFRDNLVPWSGDHVGVDISVVQGIFFSTVPLGLPPGWDHFDAVQLAPTILAAMGVPRPADYDSPPLVVKPEPAAQGN